MSLNITAVLMFIGAGIMTYVSYLRAQVEKHQNENAMLKSQAQETEWKQQIDAAKVKVTESEKDFSDTSADFRTKYPDGGSSGTK